MIPFASYPTLVCNHLHTVFIFPIFKPKFGYQKELQRGKKNGMFEKGIEV